MTSVHNAEAAKQLYAAIKDYRQGAQTYEALITLARKLYAAEGKTVRVYVRRKRHAWNAPYGAEIIDSAHGSLRDVVINVGE